MKYLLVLVGCISLILFSCIKNHDPDPTKQQKPGSVNPGNKKVSFKVTDIYSKFSAIRRRIDIINKRTNMVLGRMFLTLSCDDPNDNLYRKIKYEPEKFSGQITLESTHLIEFTKKIVNGKLIKVEKMVRKDSNASYKPGILDPEPDPISDPISDPGNTLDVTYSTQACINNKLDAMSWLEYAACLIEGLICIARNLTACIK